MTPHQQYTANVLVDGRAFFGDGNGGFAEVPSNIFPAYRVLQNKAETLCWFLLGQSGVEGTALRPGGSRSYETEAEADPQK
jgi:hypothetical protein